MAWPGRASAHADLRQLLPLLLPKARVQITRHQEELLRSSGWGSAASQRQLGPAFYVFLRQGGYWDLLPSAEREQFEREYRQNLAFHLAREDVLAQLLEALQAAGQVPVLLKGLAFANELYPDPAARFVGDIDLLVEVGAQAEVRRCFQRAGLEEMIHGARPPGRLRSAWRGVVAFGHRRSEAPAAGQKTAEGETVFRARVADHDVLVEVHYRLINLRAGGGKERVFHSRLEGEPKLRSLRLAAGEVRVLEYAETFLYALRHIALHHRLIGFRWHHDLALMLVQWEKHLDPCEIRSRCEALHSAKILRVELAILRELFGAGVFPEDAALPWERGALPWEYPLYRHVARGGKRTPWRELVRTLLAPGWREQLETLT